MTLIHGVLLSEFSGRTLRATAQAESLRDKLSRRATTSNAPAERCRKPTRDAEKHFNAPRQFPNTQISKNYSPSERASFLTHSFGRGTTDTMSCHPLHLSPLPTRGVELFWVESAPSTRALHATRRVKGFRYPRRTLCTTTPGATRRDSTITSASPTGASCSD